MSRVIFDLVEKELAKLPLQIRKKLYGWAQSVEEKGLQHVRTIKGYHDEPLQGKRFGQRSIRLNRAYRAIYIEKIDKSISIILIIEVNKHEY